MKAKAKAKNYGHNLWLKEIEKKRKNNSVSCSIENWSLVKVLNRSNS